MKVRAGVIGTGWVAQHRHIPSLETHRDVELVAVFDRDPSRAAAAAERAHIPRWNADLHEFLAHDLDVVTIATPPWTHAELAAAAFAAGSHVFTEKPMAMSLHEAQQMTAAADAADRMLCVSHNFLFSRAVRKAKEFLGSDPELDYVLGVQLSSLERRLPDWYHDLPGGLLFDEVPHLLYLAHHFLGGLHVDHVRAVGSRGSERRSVEVLVHGPAASGQVTMVFGAAVSEWHVVLSGRRGVVVLDLFRDIAVRIGPDGAHKPLDILRSSSQATAHHAAGFVASGARYVTRRSFWGHDLLIHRFIDASLRLGPTPVPVEDALAVVAAVDHIVSELTTATS